MTNLLQYEASAVVVELLVFVSCDAREFADWAHVLQ